MSGRGRGRGRGRNNNQENHEVEETDYSPPASLPVVEDKPKKVRAPPSKSNDELKRNMDIAKSRIAAIIDMLADDDADVSLKRNVNVAVKHLRVIHDLLDV